jgi:hypothetical protein
MHMPVTPRRVLWSAALAAALLVPAVASAQPGGPGGGRGGRGGFGGDPNQFFDMLSQGRDVIIRSQVDPRMLRMFDRIGIQGEQITRQQFVEGMQKAQMQGGGGGGRGPGSPGGPTPAGPAGPGGPPGADGGSRWSGGAGGGGGGLDTFLEYRFRQYDRRGDGRLTADEVPDELKAEFKKWDANEDGFIDLAEYKSFAVARMQQLQQDRGGDLSNYVPGVSPPRPEEEERKPPTFYRAGKLPKDIPSWFTEYDTNQDAQIDLCEWRKAGQPVNKFLEMDRNGDGVLSVEEVMRYVHLSSPNPDGSAVVSANPSDMGSRPGFGAPGGPGGFGSGRPSFGPGSFGRPGFGSQGSPSPGDAISGGDPNARRDKTGGGQRDGSNGKDRSSFRGPGGGQSGPSGPGGGRGTRGQRPGGDNPPG